MLVLGVFSIVVLYAAAATGCLKVVREAAAERDFVIAAAFAGFTGILTTIFVGALRLVAAAASSMLV